jgi:hypothetical protein
MGSLVTATSSMAVETVEDYEGQQAVSTLYLDSTGDYNQPDKNVKKTYLFEQLKTTK